MSRESKVHHGKVGNVSRSCDFQQNVTLYFKTCSYKLKTCSACPIGKSAKTVIYYKWLMTSASFTHTSDGMMFHKKIILRRPVGGWRWGGIGKERWKDLSKKLILIERTSVTKIFYNTKQPLIWTVRTKENLIIIFPKYMYNYMYQAVYITYIFLKIRTHMVLYRLLWKHFIVFICCSHLL